MFTGATSRLVLANLCSCLGIMVTHCIIPVLYADRDFWSTELSGPECLDHGIMRVMRFGIAVEHHDRGARWHCAAGAGS